MWEDDKRLLYVALQEKNPTKGPSADEREIHTYNILSLIASSPAPPSPVAFPPPSGPNRSIAYPNRWLHHETYLQINPQSH